MKKPYLEAVEEEKDRERPVGMSFIFRFYIPDLRYIALLFCLENDILKPKIIHLSSNR